MKASVWRDYHHYLKKHVFPVLMCNLPDMYQYQQTQSVLHWLYSCSIPGVKVFIWSGLSLIQCAPQVLKYFWNTINLNIKLQSRNCSASLFCQPTLRPEPPLPITIGSVLNHLLFSDCVCSPTSQVSPSLHSHSHTVCPSVAGGSPRLLDGHHYNICL